MYVHKACKMKEMELDFEKRAGGFCAVCQQEGTIYHVRGTADFYQYILAGVLYAMQDGESFNTRAAVRARMRELHEQARGVRRMDAHNESVPFWMQLRDSGSFESDWIEPTVKTLPERVGDALEKAAEAIAEKTFKAVEAETESIEAETVEEDTVFLGLGESTEDANTPEVEESDTVEEDTPTPDNTIDTIRGIEGEEAEAVESEEEEQESEEPAGVDQGDAEEEEAGEEAALGIIVPSDKKDWDDVLDEKMAELEPEPDLEDMTKEELLEILRSRE